MSQQPENKTSSGLQENAAGLLCYLLGWITGIIFLVIEPNNKFVRFHAVQSIIVFGALNVIMLIFGWIPFIGWIIDILLGITTFILWIILMYKAYQGLMFKLPVAGDIAQKQAESINKK
jgi:uncharacterized membrane protein